MSGITANISIITAGPDMSYERAGRCSPVGLTLDSTISEFYNF